MQAASPWENSLLSLHGFQRSVKEDGETDEPKKVDCGSKKGLYSFSPFTSISCCLYTSTADEVFSVMKLLCHMVSDVTLAENTK